MASVQPVVTKASINMYADDTALCGSHSNAITAAKIVSDDLAKIHNRNYLIINSKKTYAMLPSRNKTNLLHQHNNAIMPPSYWRISPSNSL